MRESQPVRRFLIETFMVIPDTLEERRWLVDRVKKNKENSLLWDYDPGDEIAQRPYSQRKEHLNDTYLVTGYELSHVGLHPHLHDWLRIEEELYNSVGYEHMFQGDHERKVGCRMLYGGPSGWQRTYLSMVIENLSLLVADSSLLLQHASDGIPDLIQEIEWYEERHRADRYFELEGDYPDLVERLNFKDDQIRFLTTASPYAWTCLQHLMESDKLARYLTESMVDAIKAGEKEKFMHLYAHEKAMVKRWKNPHEPESLLYQTWEPITMTVREFFSENECNPLRIPENYPKPTKPPIQDDDVPF